MKTSVGCAGSNCTALLPLLLHTAYMFPFAAASSMLSAASAAAAAAAAAAANTSLNLEVHPMMVGSLRSSLDYSLGQWLVTSELAMTTI